MTALHSPRPLPHSFALTAPLASLASLLILGLFLLVTRAASPAIQFPALTTPIIIPLIETSPHLTLLSPEIPLATEEELDQLEIAKPPRRNSALLALLEDSPTLDLSDLPLEESTPASDSSESSDTTAIPEPTTLSLFALASLALLLRRRK